MKMKCFYKSLGTSAAVLALATAGHAVAQSIDYGSLQTLFNEPVTTSATGSPQRATEAPADMQIISADDIRRSGETELPGILQRVAGMDVLNFSVGQSDLNERGYDQVSSPRLLVLVNGRQVYLDHYGLTFWQTIPVQLSEIRQIEVVKGPACALFGFNAVSGVVNIITYNPKFDNTNFATVSSGTGDYSNVSAATTFKLGDRVSARLSGGVKSQDEWATNGTLPLPSQIRSPGSLSTEADVVTQLSDKTELRLEGSWSNVQQDSLAGSSYGVDKMITGSGKATLTSETRFGLVTAQAYQNLLTAKYTFGTWNTTTDVASAQDLFKIGANNTLRLSLEARHNEIDTAPIAGGQVSYNLLSPSFMWNWAITDAVTSTLAVREDTLALHRSGSFPVRIPFADNALWDHSFTQPSVNLTLGWRPTPKDSLRLSYARGVQAPSLFEYGGLQLASTPAPNFTIDLMGNPNLKPSIVTDDEIAYDHDFTVAKFGLRLFKQDWTDIKSAVGAEGLDLYPTATTNAAEIYVNASDSKETGIELTASGKLPQNLKWTADYTGTDVKDKLYPGMNAVTRNIAFQETTPKYRGNVGLDWSHGPWEANANVHYVGNFMWYDITNGALQPVEAYTSISSRVGYNMDGGVILALSGQNLGSDRQKQTRGLEADRRMQVTITKTW